MTKKIITTFLILASLTLYSQNNKHLRLYANMGVQINQLNSNFNTDLATNYSFQIGAGSSYKLKQFVVGTEFYNSKGTTENNNNKIDSQEFTSIIYFGYDFLKCTNAALEPTLGISFSNKQSILYDYQNQKSLVYKINQLGITPALTYTKFNSLGVSIGFKIGCNYTLNNNNWNKGIDDTKTNNAINKFTPFIQLNIGGKIKLFKNK